MLGVFRLTVFLWVSNTVLEILNLGPADISTNGNREDLFVAVHNRVYNRWEGRVVGSQGDSSDCSDGARERLEQLCLLNVENAGRECVALVVDLKDTHSIGEGRDVQHVEKGSLGSSDLATGLDELQVGGDFDGTTGNLGWDTECLEERGLSGFHTSVTSGDVDIIGGNGTSSGGSGNLVGEDLVTDGLQIGVGEDKSDVALDEGEEALVLGGVDLEALEGTTDLFTSKSASELLPRSHAASPYHGVLSHQDDTFAAERLSDLVHLLGADIVDADDENALVLLKKGLKLVEVASLVLGSAPHIFLC